MSSRSLPAHSALIMPSSIILSTVSCSDFSSGVNCTPNSRVARLLLTRPTFTPDAVYAAHREARHSQSLTHNRRRQQGWCGTRRV